jgi:uncharacterized protein (DUF58 family)|tara:strand:+ start:5794 stop:7050 length:1257 start_codon:yes stop_codon:yes gene_type:complete
LSFWFRILFTIAILVSLTLGVLLLLDFFLLYRFKKGIIANRKVADKLSNADENSIELYFKNNFPFKIHIIVIDEIPFQFQKRDFLEKSILEKEEEKTIKYNITPFTRGEYHFGDLNVYVSTPLKIIARRFLFDNNRMTAVYPSYMQMKKYEFLAMSNRLSEFGIKKIRKIGHTMEFEQIKTYVNGDDVRTINWKSTAKKGAIMVNQYQDEKSQPIYSLIDIGRVMKMPFEELKLLDYAINSTLAFSNIALRKNDKVGMLTFSRKVENVVVASNKKTNLAVLNEVLYKINTDYSDSDYGLLYGMIKRKVTQRSLLILYTNFEHISGLERQIPYLKLIAKQHVLLTVFFENTELEELISEDAENLETIYEKTIAQKFFYEKKLIVKELEKHGVYAILTKPKNLSVNVINKYLEFKSKGLI